MFMKNSGSEIGLTAGLPIQEIGAETRGQLDICDPERGISGWAVDPVRPETSQTIQLQVDDIVLMTCKTEIVHDDLADIMTGDITGRFAFSQHAVAMLGALADMFGHARITARVAETGFVLPFARGQVVLGDVFGKVTDNARSNGGFDLKTRLAELQVRAAELVPLSADPPPDCLTGLIEVAAIDEAGEVWVNGWM